MGAFDAQNKAAAAETAAPAEQR